MKRILPSSNRSTWGRLLLCLCLLAQGSWAAVSSINMLVMQQHMLQMRASNRTDSCTTHNNMPTGAAPILQGCTAKPNAGIDPHASHRRALSTHHLDIHHLAQEQLESVSGQHTHSASARSDPDQAAADCDCQCDCQQDCLRAWHSAFALQLSPLRNGPARVMQTLSQQGPAPYQPEVALRPPIALI